MRAFRVTSMMKNRSHAIAKQAFMRRWQVDPLHARKRLNGKQPVCLGKSRFAEVASEAPHETRESPSHIVATVFVHVERAHLAPSVRQWEQPPRQPSCYLPAACRAHHHPAGEGWG